MSLALPALSESTWPPLYSVIISGLAAMTVIALLIIPYLYLLITPDQN